MKDNTDILNQLQADATAAQATHEQIYGKMMDWSEEYESHNIINHRQNTGYGTAANHEVSGMKMKDIKRTVESALPDITAPFLSSDNIVEVQPTTANAKAKADAYTRVINQRFSKGMDKIPFVESIARMVQVEGTVFVKVGYEDAPVVELLQNSEIMIDPSARELKQANFVIQRRKVSINSILNNPEWYGKQTLDSLSTVEAVSETSHDDTRHSDGYGRDDSFNFDDRLRQLVETFEYYGMLDIGNGLEPIIAIWSDNTLINVEPSPYPPEWNGIPFESCVYIRKPFSVYGESLPAILADYQQIRNAFMQGIITNASLANNGQKFFQKGAIDFPNMKKMASGERYIFTNRPPSEVLVDGSYNEIPASVFHIMETMKVEQEELSGISRMNAGVDARALNGTATAANLVNDNAQKRILQVSRHISEMLERVFKKWIDLYQHIGDDITIKDGDDFFTVPAEALSGSFDLNMVAGTAGLEQQRMASIQMMMETMKGSGQQIPSEVFMMMMSEMANIAKLPQLSATLKELSTPDEEQQGQQQQQEQVQQMAMQLEAQKMQSETAKNNASAQKYMAESFKTQIDAENASYGL